MGRRFNQAGGVIQFDESGLVTSTGDSVSSSNTSTRQGLATKMGRPTTRSADTSLDREDRLPRKKLKKSGGDKGGKEDTVFQRQMADGSTSLAIITPGDGVVPGTERDRPISLGNLIGRVKYGTSQLSPFREDKRNMVKPMLPISYNMFSSFGPTYDSTFANMTVEESRLVMSSDEPPTQRRFLRRQEHRELIRNVCQGATDAYSRTFVDHMIGIFEGREVKDEDYAPVKEPTTPTDDKATTTSTPEKKWTPLPVEASGQVVNFDSLKSLSDDGIDMSFLDNLQTHYESRVLEGTSSGSSDDVVANKLDHNASLLTNLRAQQTSRLSAPLPINLSHVNGPSEREVRLAQKVVENLTTIIGSAAMPGHVSHVTGIRKAMGVSFPEEKKEEPEPTKQSENETNPDHKKAEEKADDNAEPPKEDNSKETETVEKVEPTPPVEAPSVENVAEKEVKREMLADQPTAAGDGPPPPPPVQPSNQETKMETETSQ